MSLLTRIRTYFTRTFVTQTPTSSGVLFRIHHKKIHLLSAVQARSRARSYVEVINDALTAWNYLTKKIEAGSVFIEIEKDGQEIELDFVASVRPSSPPPKKRPHLYLVKNEDTE